MITESQRRSDRAHQIVLVYRGWHDHQGDDDSVIVDLLADLRRFCDEYAVDWDAAVIDSAHVSAALNLLP